MSIWTCGIRAFSRKTKGDMSVEDRAKIEKRMNDLALEWDSKKSDVFRMLKRLNGIILKHLNGCGRNIHIKS